MNSHSVASPRAAARKRSLQDGCVIDNKILEILEEVAEAAVAAIAIGDYKKANDFMDVLDAAKEDAKELDRKRKR